MQASKASQKSANEDFKNAFYALRESARKNGVQDMTLDEINEEIRLAREEMDAKKLSKLRRDWLPDYSSMEL